MYWQLQRCGYRLLNRRWGNRGRNTRMCSHSRSKQQIETGSTRTGTPNVEHMATKAAKHEAELDSSIARIIGSDWGDRSHQPVSLSMRIYWIVFTVVLGNGLYTSFTGKDEWFFVKWLTDEQICNDDNDAKAPRQSAYCNTNDTQEQTTPVVVSTLPHRALSSPGMPFLAPGMTIKARATRVTSEIELAHQLVQLQEQQECLLKQIRASREKSNAELEHQVRMLDIQKAQVQKMLQDYKLSNS